MFCKISYSLLIMIVLLSTSAINARTYRRSCKAVFKIVNQNRNMVPVYVEEFSAKASAGRFIPNTIRLRAYRKAIKCMKQAWENESHRPEECTPAKGINNYETGHLINAVTSAACEKWNWTGRLRVQAYASIRGDKGCGGDRKKKDVQVKLAEWYPIFCR